MKPQTDKSKNTLQQKETDIDSRALEELEDDALGLFSVPKHIYEKVKSKKQ